MAKAIEERRESLGMSPTEMGRRADLSAEGLRNVRGGHERNYQYKVRLGVARALRWPLDWYDRFKNGEDASTFPDVDHDAPERSRTVEDRIAALEKQMGLAPSAPDSRSVEERLAELERLSAKGHSNAH